MKERAGQEERPVAEGPPSIGRIFLEFLKLGLTAFGGPAIIAHIRELAVRRHAWVDNGTFTDGVVLSQSIPGATAMQVAAYVGLKSRGLAGASAAYAGLGLPAFFLMLLLSAFYAASRSVAPVLALFGGLQVIVVSIVAHAAFSFGRDIRTDGRSVALALLSAALLFFGASPFVVIIGAAAAGVLLFRDVRPGGDGRSPAGAAPCTRPSLR